MSIFRSRRRVFGATFAAVLAASLASITTFADPAEAAFKDGPCIGTEGVTVVVDFGAFGGEPVARCALGPQATGLDALANAGFATTFVPGQPFVCTIDAMPVEGHPLCQDGGFWAYWQPDGDAWGFAMDGAHATHPAPGAVEGWSFGFAPDYNALVPSIGPNFGTTEPTDTTTTTTTVPSEPSGPGAPAAAAWLEAELAAGYMPGFSPDLPDWGLTADAVLALAAAGMGDAPNAQLATQQLAEHVSAFATFDDFGIPDVRIAGSFAKLLLVFAVQGEDVNDAGGWDVEAELRALIQPSGQYADAPIEDDVSNLFGQSLAILGLQRTDGGVPPAAIDFLLSQQCPEGGFRLFYVPPGTGCANDSDATGLAVQALLVVDRTPAVEAALAHAIAWLLSRQDASGAWGGTGPTAAINSSSTGLIAVALRAAGETAAADRGASWVQSLQLGGAPAVATTLALAAAIPGDAGAIAYDQAAFAAAAADGIGEFARDPFRRATSQAILALGLPAYGSINQQSPEPVTTTTTTPATTTTAVAASPTTLAVVGTTGTTGPTAPDVSADASSGDSGSLPFTGSSLLPLLLGVSVALLASGAVFARTRRRVMR